MVYDINATGRTVPIERGEDLEDNEKLRDSIVVGNIIQISHESDPLCQNALYEVKRWDGAKGTYDIMSWPCPNGMQGPIEYFGIKPSGTKWKLHKIFRRDIPEHLIVNLSRMDGPLNAIDINPTGWFWEKRLHNDREYTQHELRELLEVGDMIYTQKKEVLEVLEDNFGSVSVKNHCTGDIYNLIKRPRTGKFQVIISLLTRGLCVGVNINRQISEVIVADIYGNRFDLPTDKKLWSHDYSGKLTMLSMAQDPNMHEPYGIGVCELLKSKRSDVQDAIHHAIDTNMKSKVTHHITRRKGCPELFEFVMDFGRGEDHIPNTGPSEPLSAVKILETMRSLSSNNQPKTMSAIKQLASKMFFTDEKNSQLVQKYQSAQDFASALGKTLYILNRIQKLVQEAARNLDNVVGQEDAELAAVLEKKLDAFLDTLLYDEKLNVKEVIEMRKPLKATLEKLEALDLKSLDNDED